MYEVLRIANELFDSTTTATEDLSPWIPVRKRKHFLGLRVCLMLMFAFGVFCTAVFAEPAVTKIKEVVGLIH